MFQDVVVAAAKRTPFGAFGGSLKDWSATDLAVHAAQAALGGLKGFEERIGHVYFGNVMQTASDAAYLARHVGLRAGLPIAVPALTVNRLCGSGFEAVAQGAQAITRGETEAVLVGGSESMSQAPYVLRQGRFGYRMGHGPLEDSLTAGLTDAYAGMPMAITAEELAKDKGITRAECDALALLSQQRVQTALKAGAFDDEMAVIEKPSPRAKEPLVRDEHPRADISAAGLEKLRPVFVKEGVVTAGNASGMVDGACALVLCRRGSAKTWGWPVLGEVVDAVAVGCDPKRMGIGPVPALNALWARNRLGAGDMHWIEVNEAFAAQYLAVERELKLDREKTNPDGGAIALGHPLGATGARLVAHALYGLRRRGGGVGAVSACIGGGQGMAVLLKV